MHESSRKARSVKILDDHDIALSGIGAGVNQPSADTSIPSTGPTCGPKSTGVEWRDPVDVLNLIKMACSGRRPISKTDVASAKMPVLAAFRDVDHLPFSFVAKIVSPLFGVKYSSSLH
jgi:hypothetical protein